MRRAWQHYAAPAAFLLAATIAVVLIRAGFESGGSRSPTVPTTASTTRELPRFWRVRAGDTLASIATVTGVTLERLRALNPKAHPTALTIGERLRLR